MGTEGRPRDLELSYVAMTPKTDCSIASTTGFSAPASPCCGGCTYHRSIEPALAALTHGVSEICHEVLLSTMTQMAIRGPFGVRTHAL